MSKDISTQFTKERNHKHGRRGYYEWKEKKEDVISPRDYGMFISGKRQKKK